MLEFRLYRTNKIWIIASVFKFVSIAMMFCFENIASYPEIFTIFRFKQTKRSKEYYRGRRGEIIFSSLFAISRCGHWEGVRFW